jgi:hypothetical protein
VLVRSAVGLRHQQAILAQCGGFGLPLTDDGFVLGIARLRLGSRPPPRRDREYLKRVIEPFANEIDTITDRDPVSGRCTLTIQAHMPARYGICCLAAGFEETTEKEPAVDAQGRWAWWGHFEMLAGRVDADADECNQHTPRSVPYSWTSLSFSGLLSGNKLTVEMKHPNSASAETRFRLGIPTLKLGLRARMEGFWNSLGPRTITGDKAFDKQVVVTDTTQVLCGNF